MMKFVDILLYTTAHSKMSFFEITAETFEERLGWIVSNEHPVTN